MCGEADAVVRLGDAHLVAALLSELSVSVVALVTVPPGTAASAAAEAEDRVVPVNAVSLELVVEVELVPVVELEDDDEFVV